MLPLVRLVIPCRNEAHAITETIRSLLAQDYPPELMELIFVDGMSTDRTREVIRQLTAGVLQPVVRLIDNPEQSTAAGLNRGIAVALGEVIFTVGAHTWYSRDYVSKAVTALNEWDAMAVGGVAQTEPSEQTPKGQAIALALSSWFGVGNSLMRLGTDRMRTADTASCPAYRRIVFDRLGRFNPELVRNQDLEFNRRLVRAGMRLLLHPGMVSYYRCRSTLRSVVVNAFENGYWVVRSIRYAGIGFCPRHLVPGVFVVVLVAAWLGEVVVGWGLVPFGVVAGTYLVAVFAASLQRMSAQVRKGQDKVRISALLVLPAVFPLLHLSYGLGSLWALLTLWRSSKRREQSNEDKIRTLAGRLTKFLRRG